jgi:hypothetical protein
MARLSTNSARELHSEDIPLRPYQALDMTQPQAVRPTDIIQSVDDDVLIGTYAEQLAFNEEPIEIRLEPRQERNAPRVQDVSVNGDRRWLPIGVPIRIQRKFVEVMARAQPYGVETDVGNATVDNPHNIIHKRPFRAVPFSVLHDPNPRGAAWLNKISFEG